MSRRAKQLLAELVDALKAHDWADIDLLDFLGSPRLKPSYYPLSQLYRTARLFQWWLIVKADGGRPSDNDVLDRIDQFTRDHKARRREDQAWRNEVVNLLGVHPSRTSMGPVTDIPAISISFASCNLHCPTCPYPDVWGGGKMISVLGIEKMVKHLYANESVLLLNGGEPLLWQHSPALMEMMGRWHSGRKTITLRTNGTILPRKIFADLCTTIVIEPDLSVRRDVDEWMRTIEYYESRYAPIWSPVIATYTADKIAELWHRVDPERVYPQIRDTKDLTALIRTASDQGWHVPTPSK